MNKLRINVMKHSTDENGQPSGRGLLGNNIRGRQIDHEASRDERVVFN